MVSARSAIDQGERVGLIRGALAGFTDLVGVAQELIRAQSGGRLPSALRLEGISHTAADLLVEAGAVDTRSEGIVLFHERISRDKPNLRKILRKSDRVSGHLKPIKRTKAQKAVTTAVKAGMVKRDKDGKLKGLTPAAHRKIRAIQRKAGSARRKATIERQKRFASRLRSL